MVDSVGLTFTIIGLDALSKVVPSEREPDHSPVFSPVMLIAISASEPEQIIGFPEIAAVGSAFTITSISALVSAFPLSSVTVTKYFPD